MLFPAAYWPAWDADATFTPLAASPDNDRGRPWAALTFVFHGDQVVLADIAGRGYCIPSGKIESGETPAEAAAREAWEETGARFRGGSLRPIGCYLLTPRGGAHAGQSRVCPVFIAEAESFEPIPTGSESQGLLLARIEDIPALYFFWDDLVAAVFAYAHEQYRRLSAEGASA